MKRPLKNVVSLFAGDVGVRILGFLVIVYLARVLEPSAFGIMNIGLSILAYLLMVGSPGVQMLEARNAASGAADDRRVHAILSLRLVLAILLLLAVSIGSFFVFSSPVVRSTVLLFGVSLLPLALFLDWFYQGKERFAVVSLARIINSVVYGVCVVLLVRSGEDLVWVPVAFGLGNVVATTLLLVRYHRTYGLSGFAWQAAEWKNILRSNIPVGFSVFLSQSAVHLPPIALGWLASTAEAGVFSAAMKIIFVLLMLDRVLNALLLPVATRYFTVRAAEAPFLLATVTKLLLAVVIPMAACGVLLSPVAIHAVFGNVYDGAIPILQILFGYFVLTLLNSVFVCALVGAGRENEYSAAVNTGSVMFIVAIVSGTLLFGGRGAAIGVVWGELVTVALMFARVRRFVDVSATAVLLRPLMAAASMVAIILALRGWHVASQLLAGIGTFVIVAAISKTIQMNDIRFLREKFV